MKSSLSLRAALIGVLFAAAGCGGSGSADVGGGTKDASLESGPSTVGEAGPDTSLPPASEGGGDDDTTGDGGSVCGDGIVGGAELCDDGTSNGTPGDPCTNSCTWVCTLGDPNSASCSDGNACNGVETCQANHSCAPGTPPANGSTCGTAKLCNGGVCADAVCGDGFVTAPEECDDGSNNGTASDGCTKACMFVCVSTDPTRNCTPADPCQGKGTCDDATHVCAPGTQEGNGTICSDLAGSLSDGGAGDAGDAGTIDVCKGGTCVTGYCGDGVVEAPEQCDFGASNAAGSGCELNCTFSCAKTPSNSCVTTDICAGTNTCTTVTVSNHSGQKCVVGTPPASGSPCPNGTCSNDKCQSSLCGNGVLDNGEQCDFGAGHNVAGSGCEANCTYSCQTDPDSCANNDLCSASPTTCQGVTGPNVDAGAADHGQKCQAATGIAQCADCGATTSGVCVSHACATSTCGDGCVDARRGETCEPPNTATCDSECHTIVPAVCGNSIRETGEQCDDGNKTNLDGCDSTCQFEQIQRATSVSIEGSTSTFCPKNALGSVALTSTATGQLNTSLTTAVNAGTTTIELKFMGITDLAGTSQTSGLGLGAFSGTFVTAPAGKTYNGASDLDWWYTTAATTIDANRNPNSILGAQFNAAVLTTPTRGTFSVTISIAGSLATLNMSNAAVQADIGATSVPTVSTGTTPGHLASEHLNPTLTSFAQMNNGLLCGNISAASLAQVVVPAELATGGSYACGQGYSATTTPPNSLLDVLVGGCTYLIFVDIVNATQPDQSNPVGTTYTLTTTGTRVTGCKQGTKTIDLTTCLGEAAYSSYFGFTSDRVIAK
jgi:cysteine-rich repeat protein